MIVTESKTRAVQERRDESPRVQRAGNLARQSGLASRRGAAGFGLLLAAEFLILIRLRPLSDYYFPLAWIGYILFLDAATERQCGHSLFHNRRKLFYALFPISIAFWWLFEGFNLVVQNWYYVGGEHYAGLAFVVIASIDFSTVLPAVWVTAFLLLALLDRLPMRGRQYRDVPRPLLVLMLVAGVICVTLPFLAPRYAYGLIWGSMYLLLDPTNCLRGRPSMTRRAWNGDWAMVASFAFGALMCGFFWEAWNYWALSKWKYSIPYVGFWHIFEMPLLGWLGYLPFGLELYAMANFVFPLLRIEPGEPDQSALTSDEYREQRAS